MSYVIIKHVKNKVQLVTEVVFQRFFTGLLILSEQNKIKSSINIIPEKAKGCN